MNELDMSAPGSELFPEQGQTQYNSYQDVNVQGQSVGDPLNSGVEQGNFDVAGQSATAPVSDKEYNFRALGETVNKLKEEASYWKGQAEAYSKVPSRQQESTQQDAYAALDWDDSKDVRRAFETLREQNAAMKNELQDAITAIGTKSQHADWNNMVTKHVPELTSKNPIFAEMIKNASNPYEAAYLLAELNSKASQPVQQPNMGNGQRAMHNAQKPQTLASVGGGGQLSSADYYASMSDEDFMKIAGRNLANI
jgi:hypothetical protein